MSIATADGAHVKNFYQSVSKLTRRKIRKEKKKGYCKAFCVARNLKNGFKYLFYFLVTHIHADIRLPALYLEVNESVNQWLNLIICIQIDFQSIGLIDSSHYSIYCWVQDLSILKLAKGSEMFSLLV